MLAVTNFEEIKGPELDNNEFYTGNSSSLIAGNAAELAHDNLVDINIGTNLNIIADWSTELPFLDAFKSSRSWITQNNGVWNTQESDELDLDEDGWVRSLPAPEDRTNYTSVATLLYNGLGDYGYEPGRYVVLYDGEGTIEYNWDAQQDEDASTSGRDVLDVTPSNRGIYLKITSTDPNNTGDYIRNIRVVPEAYENTHTSEIFNPEFIEKVDDFEVFRFMDWMDTNESEQSEWERSTHF